MKKATSILYCLLLAVSLLYPAGLLICTGLGYEFKPVSTTAFAVVIALLSVCAVVFSMLSGEKNEHKLDMILSSLLLPLSLINVFVYSLKCNSIPVLVCVTVASAAAFFLILGNGKRLGIKIIMLILSVIVSLPIGFCGLIGLLFGDIGYVAVVQTAESPTGEFRAEVVDINQGAMGGDTVVYVYENSKHLDLLLFTVSKEPQTVYMGPWGEFKDMKLHWTDEHCLMINGTEYDIQ